MLLAAIIILFSLLALGLLAVLDRHDTAVIKAQANRQVKPPPKLTYYDAFADRRQKNRGTPPKGQTDRRAAA